MTKGKASKATGAKALTGSPEAKRRAAVILEVLSGLRRTEDACEAISIALPRDYLPKSASAARLDLGAGAASERAPAPARR